LKSSFDLVLQEVVGIPICKSIGGRVYTRILEVPLGYLIRIEDIPGAKPSISASPINF